MKDGVFKQSIPESAKKNLKNNVSGLVKTAEDGYEVYLSYQAEGDFQPLSSSCNPNFVGQATQDFASEFSDILTEFVSNFSYTNLENFVKNCLVKANFKSEGEFLAFLGKLKELAIYKNSTLSIISYPGCRFTYPEVNLCYYQVK